MSLRFQFAKLEVSEVKPEAKSINDLQQLTKAELLANAIRNPGLAITVLNNEALYGKFLYPVIREITPAGDVRASNVVKIDSNCMNQLKAAHQGNAEIQALIRGLENRNFTLDQIQYDPQPVQRSYGYCMD